MSQSHQLELTSNISWFGSMFEAVFNESKKKIHRLIQIGSHNVLDHTYTVVAQTFVFLLHRELSYSNLALIDTIRPSILFSFAL